jgi:hypothetical protein
MKKMFFFVMLTTSITAQLCAQHSNLHLFGIPEDVIINRRFFIDLQKGNRLELALTDITDLQVATNLDSFIHLLLNDLAPLKDSLANPLTIKRIDYLIDEKGRKKIRLQQHMPNASSYVIDKGELAALRTAQDSIHIVVAISQPPQPEDLVSHKDKRYFAYTFLLNDYQVMGNLLKQEALKEQLQQLHRSTNEKWKRIPGTGSYSWQGDPNVTASRPNGHAARSTRDYITLLGSANVQNYKHYFVPSFSLGARFRYTNNSRNFKREIGLAWEPNFLFAKDSSGKLQTYRNDFLTLSFSQGGVTDHDAMKPFSFSAHFTLGWLQRRSGVFFDKNTFRLGVGKIQVLKTTIEPVAYFNNFFKSVTPGIRIIQFFNPQIHYCTNRKKVYSKCGKPFCLAHFFSASDT